MFGERTLNLANPVNRASPLNRGLLAWYEDLPSPRASGSVVNLCPSTGRGVVVGGVTIGGRSAAGSLYRKFNGTSGYINCQTSGFGTVQGNRTITLWMRLTTVTSNRNAVLLYSVPGAGTLQVGYRSDVNAILAWKAGGASLVNSSITPAANSWYFVGYSWNGTTHTIVVRGAAATTVTSTTATQSGTITITKIGDSGFSEFFSGDISSVRIHSECLPERQLLGVYEASRTGYRQELNWLDRPWLAGVPAAGGFKSAWARNSNTIINPLVTA